MTDEEIVKVDCAKNNSAFKEETCLRAYRNALEQGLVRIRAGNSLMFIRHLGEGKGHFHFVNADRMSDFIVNVGKCLKEARELGFKELTTNFDNPKIIEVAGTQPYDIKIERKPVNGVEQYWMTVRL